MKQKISSWVNGALHQQRRLAIPILTSPGIELIGHTLREAVTDGNIHAEAIKKLDELYSSDASTAIMDLTVEAEAFGAHVVFTDHDIPNVVGRMLTDNDAVSALDIPSLDAARVPEYLKANRLAVQSITDKPVFAGCSGPFTLAGRLFDLSELLMAIYMEPDTVVSLLDKCTTFLISYCQAIKQTGAAGVIMAEPAAGLISNDDCMNYSTPYIRKIVEAVQDDDFIVILHNCGNTGHCTQAMIATDARGLHFGNKINITDALAECPSDVIVMGNLDPVSVFKQSAAEEVYRQTMDLLRSTERYPNFILSSGCDVPPMIPIANITSFYEALNNFNQYK
jgi:uroporphyrinogen decarboxylase